ncbi:MAG: potassium-transporting ATPase subunit KdpA [Proteobacteria bacterium]|nr:MAG: potassium-transporting ATPase subunit KdpA [Pseudomonadota bacterium]
MFSFIVLLIVFLLILFLLAKPLGLYLQKVLDAQQKTFLSPLLGPIERLFYRIARVNPGADQTWTQYGGALFAFSAVSFVVTYLVIRFQSFLPLNPQGLGNLTDHLALNTAISFLSNTNWQSYGGETTMSYFAQMTALTLQNFLSAAAGIAVAAALVRGLAAETKKGVGNFWSDIVRINLYLLLPLSIVYAVFLVSQGVIQNFSAYTSILGLDNNFQTLLAQGPVASQAAIKMLGTNGGGFFNANAAHPFENPNALSNFVQMISIFLIPSALTYYLGSMVKNRKHGYAIWATMAILFSIMAIVCWWAESSPNPHLLSLGIDPMHANMEGKEVRFGILQSSFFATITTAASCGAVNAMHDSFTPLGGLVTLLNMQLGEVIFGGVGAGLYGMLIFVVLSIFIAGLMIGRTPEYLGKKIEAYEVKASALYILVAAISILGLTALAAQSKWAIAGLNNAGPHGLTEMLYAFTSATANNGSAFAGLTANTMPYNLTLALAMFVGRFLLILPVLALAGSFANKKRVSTNVGSFPVHGPTFVILLLGIVIIVGALTFLPSLALGPIVEHFILTGSNQLY